MTEPDGYRGFIGAMADLAGQSVAAQRIRDTGHAERGNAGDLPLSALEQDRKALLLAFTPEQRALLADLLVDERRAAVHDVLAYLEWAVSCDRLEIRAAGQSFAGAQDETMHGDFIARMAEQEGQG